MSNETNQARLIDHSQRQGRFDTTHHLALSHIHFLDEEVVAKLAELDMVAVELEAATSRVATVERRNVRRMHLHSKAPLTYTPLGDTAGRD